MVRINNKSKAKKREFSKSINERNVLTDSIDSKDENKLSSFVIKNLSKSLTKIEEKSLVMKYVYRFTVNILYTNLTIFILGSFIKNGKKLYLGILYRV